jgi:hypothetical protein
MMPCARHHSSAVPTAAQSRPLHQTGAIAQLDSPRDRPAANHVASPVVLLLLPRVNNHAHLRAMLVRRGLVSVSASPARSEVSLTYPTPGLALR